MAIDEGWEPMGLLHVAADMALREALRLRVLGHLLGALIHEREARLNRGNLEIT